MESRPQEARWTAHTVESATQFMSGGLADAWSASPELIGPSGEKHELSGYFNIQTAYPVDASSIEDSWDAICAGRVPFMPAGPSFGPPGFIGPALCHYNLLREVARLVERAER